VPKPHAGSLCLPRVDFTQLANAFDREWLIMEPLFVTLSFIEGSRFEQALAKQWTKRSRTRVLKSTWDCAGAPPRRRSFCWLCCNDFNMK
jgi:hypothetical protein